jgi:glycosyltransferase A (GT-A) superfamily protein (DUF2064 family)
MTPAILVLAKEPRPGTSKTRLCPPCSAEEAATLARAALDDTLRAVGAVPASRKVLVYDGKAGAVTLPAGFEVIEQRGRDLNERLAAAFEDAKGPGFLIGMDTPQVTPELLTRRSMRFSSPESTPFSAGRSMEGSGGSDSPLSRRAHSSMCR